MRPEDEPDFGVISVAVFEVEYVLVMHVDEFGNVTHFYFARERPLDASGGVDGDDDFIVDIDPDESSD